MLSSVLVISGTAAKPQVEMEKIPVIIMFKDKPNIDLIKLHHGEIKSVYHIKPALAASLPKNVIDVLGKHSEIEYIVEDKEVFLVGQELPWGVDRIDADVVHSCNKGTGVNTAIMDTGIDYTHGDLNDNYYGGYDFGGRIVWLGRNDDDPMDKQGHGTHCAGIVAAEDNNIGVIGVAPEAHLYAVKVFDDMGNGGRYSDVIEGLEWCIDTHSDSDSDNDIQVISMSFGSKYSDGDPGIESWINEAYSVGILLVGAAGNEGSGDDTVIYPARYANVTAVAATDNSDNRASWSSTGPTVELSAPGVAIKSTYLNNAYETMSGTSMACPHVTGTAALVIASNPSLTNVEIRQRLQETAEDLGPAGKDDEFGYGLVDAENATYMPTPDTTPPASVTDLNESAVGETWINWTWTNPTDADFSHVMVHLDGVFKENVSKPTNYYKAINLSPNTTYEVGTHTVDTSGNINQTWVNDTAKTLTPDETPPVISDVTATDITDSSAKITWNTDEPADSLVKYGTVSRSYTNTTSNSAYVTSHAIDLTGLASDTTYYYVVNSTDQSGNSAESSEYNFTTKEAAVELEMHVGNITMSSDFIGRGQWAWYKAIATVPILDSSNNSVEGATVEGEWSGAYSESVSGTTRSDGNVTFETRWVKGGGTFTFTVDNLTREGWTYNSSANVETSDSITVP